MNLSVICAYFCYIVWQCISSNIEDILLFERNTFIWKNATLHFSKIYTVILEDIHCHTVFERMLRCTLTTHNRTVQIKAHYISAICVYLWYIWWQCISSKIVYIWDTIWCCTHKRKVRVEWSTYLIFVYVSAGLHDTVYLWNSYIWKQ